MKTNSIRFIFLIVMIFYYACANNLQLKLNFKEGDTYNLKMTADQKIKQTIQGMEHNISQKLTIGYKYNIKKIYPEGTALMDINYHTIQFKQDSPMGINEYDSTNPPKDIPPMALGFAALVGQNFSIIITPKGNVKKIEGIDAMLTNMMAKMNIPEGNMKNVLEKNLKDQFGDKIMTENLENMMAIYPNKAITIGESWTKQLTLSSAFPMIINNTWTLKSRKNGIAIIAVDSIISPNTNAAPLDVGFMKIKYNISGKQNGTLEINEKSGWTKSAKFIQNLTGEVLIGESSWPISVDSIITLESL